MIEKCIAVFGGSFNPPTVAHVDLAKQILESMENIEKVIFIPVSTKYNKEGLAPDEERYKMLETICSTEKGFEVSSIELDTPRQLYTIETLEKIQEQYPNYKIYFILGTDNLKELETWHTASRLLEKFKVIVLERDNDSMKTIIEENSFLKKHKDAFIKLEGIKKIELSASYIREQIRSGNSISGMVPKQIENKVIEIYK